MAIAIAQIGTGGGLTTTLGAPISATMPAEPKQGNLLLAFCGADTIAASTASGFTNINTFGGNNASAVAAYKYAGTNESTTQTAAQIGYAQSQYNLGLVLELSGVPASGGYNAGATPTNASGVSNVFTGPAVTSTAGGALCSLHF